MKTQVLLRNPLVNIMLSIFAVILFTCGLQNVSYGQEAVTITLKECSGTRQGWPLENWIDITIKGTVQANKTVENLRLTGYAQPVDKFIDFVLLDTLSAGESTTFSMSGFVVLGEDDIFRSCHVRWQGLVRGTPDPDPGPTPISTGEQGICRVGDVLSPGESCTYPGTDEKFSVLGDGSGRFLFFTAGRSINARNVTVNGVRYNFAASKRADGNWEIEAAGDGGGQTPAPPDTPQNDVQNDAGNTNNQPVEITASTAAPLTEATLHESVVTLTLSGRTYARSIFDIRDAVTVSGINGVTMPWHQPKRKSDTEITIELEFDGNIDTDSTLTVTVGAAALTDYNGPALTAKMPVKSADEWVVASTSQPLTEATLHESVVTLTLSGAKYAPEYEMRDAVTVSGIQGVEIDRFGMNRVSDTQITIELAFDGKIASKETLTFTIKSSAIESYSGPALKARLSVPTQVEQREAGDANSDGVVSIQDLMLIASSFGQTGQHPADVNGDNTVDIEDLILVAAVLDADAAAAPSLHPSFLEGLTAADIQLWLTQAQHLNLADTTSQRGIRFLQQLLTAGLPQETRLLANYPNPFNPETWIPYQLSKPANVTLHIYAATGQVIRTLTLGHLPAGIYESRSHAAYWDGRNALGEPVASGVYFYTLTAGDFTATRRMLILK